MHPNGDGSTFYYIETMFYGAKSTERNRAQVAYGYNKNQTAYRYFRNGTWSEWELDSVDSDLVNYVTTSISVTSTTAEQTILSTILEKKGLYLLVGSIPLNNYGLQTGRELYIRVKINNVEVFSQLWVINSEVYTLSRTIAVLFCTTSINSELKITIQNSTSNKNWSCPSGVLQLARLK